MSENGSHSKHGKYEDGTSMNRLARSRAQTTCAAAYCYTSVSIRGSISILFYLRGRGAGGSAICYGPSFLWRCVIA